MVSRAFKNSRKLLVGLSLVWSLCAPLAQASADQTSLSARPAAANPKDEGARLRGVVKPAAQAALAAELPARIIRISHREGEAFKKDEELVTFDCRRYQADASAFEAELAAARATRSASQQLANRRAIGATELAISEAKAKKAQADLDGAMVRVSQCSVLAPFDGHVAEKIANEFEIPVASAPLLRIVDDSRLEIEMIVPSSMLATLRIGVPFDFHVDETNSDHRATVTRLPAIVDSVSQTARVFGAFVENRPPEILPGMSGSASFAKSLSNAREGGEQ